ncbi:MAG: F420-dependent methylenetetrahydromethanopterin dehydrogenase [Methanosarcinaceae archaeon]|jgi:methylenetetrahydromethanopterin dehydrogenase|nr:F420-dependent methylenetetrahydromethanopterin dehydrogenase [Methanosarcinaceae archaeon]NKQ39788.1 F420-dependent methylenetetrahydromethanopterin dehydrogenase [Methanosarcinales archaeon]
MTVTIGIIKYGNIGMSPMIDLCLDERADRKDIVVKVFSSGAKMDPASVEENTINMINEVKPDFIIAIGPNPGAPGPLKVMDLLSGSKIPSVIIGDGPGAKVKDDIKAKGLGYVIIKCDPMIGARREFLDPTEMAIFNAEVIKVLAGTGVIRLIQNIVGDLVDAIKNKTELPLPYNVINEAKAIAAMNFKNPYAKAKAMAAFTISEKVGDVDVKGCFMERDAEKYIPIVTSAHEMVRYASKLVDEARELEKVMDTVSRTPHNPDGNIMCKVALMNKPE